MSSPVPPCNVLFVVTSVVLRSFDHTNQSMDQFPSLDFAQTLSDFAWDGG